MWSIAFPAFARVIGIVLIAVSVSLLPAAESERQERRQLTDFIGTVRDGQNSGRNVSVGLLESPGRDRTRAPASGPVADGLTWLEGNQSPEGSWGTSFEIIVTSTVLESLTTLDPCTAPVETGATWLADQTIANQDFLSRQAIALADSPGFEDLAQNSAEQLLASRNAAASDPVLPNWPEGGWGLHPGFETDSQTTALALLALDRNGFNGGFEVAIGLLAGGATNLHQWEIPDDAIKVRTLITVSGSEVRLCMTEGSPPPFCNPYFPLPPGGPYQIVFPDSGLPFTTGTNFVVIESPAPPALSATYTLTASYETPTFDTRALTEPLAYLREAQNVDGGWGIQRGQPSELYATLHVLLALMRYSQYDVAAEVAAGIDYVKTQQAFDGSFGFGGPAVPYVTALAGLALLRSETSPFSTETEDAIGALLALQALDGSWDQEAYDTAIAILALWEYDLPPTADAGADQVLSDLDQDCFELVTLLGSGVSPDGAIVSYVWSEDCVQLATGSSPTVSLPAGNHDIVLTVTAADDQVARDSVLINVVETPDHDGDNVSVCEGDCDDTNDRVWSRPSAVTGLLFSSSSDFSWSPPEDLGGAEVVYDVLRSSSPSDFHSGASCLETDDGTDTSASDGAPPASGAVFYYLVRVENDCFGVEGNMGSDSAGAPRAGQSCL